MQNKNVAVGMHSRPCTAGHAQQACTVAERYRRHARPQRHSTHVRVIRRALLGVHFTCLATLGLGLGLPRRQCPMRQARTPYLERTPGPREQSTVGLCFDVNVCACRDVFVHLYATCVHVRGLVQLDIGPSAMCAHCMLHALLSCVDARGWTPCTGGRR